MSGLPIWGSGTKMSSGGIMTDCMIAWTKMWF